MTQSIVSGAVDWRWRSTVWNISSDVLIECHASNSPQKSHIKMLHMTTFRTVISALYFQISFIARNLSTDNATTVEIDILVLIWEETVEILCRLGKFTPHGWQSMYVEYKGCTKLPPSKSLNERLATKKVVGRTRKYMYGSLKRVHRRTLFVANETKPSKALQIPAKSATDAVGIPSKCPCSSWCDWAVSFMINTNGHCSSFYVETLDLMINMAEDD